MSVHSLDLLEVANKFAALDCRFNSTFVNLHGLAESALPHMPGILDAIITQDAPHPFNVACVDLRGFVSHRFVAGPAIFGAIFSQRLEPLSLPDGSYLRISSPVLSGPDCVNEALAHETIARIRGYVVAMLGRGCLSSLSAEMLVHAGAEFKQSFAGSAIRMPQPYDFAKIIRASLLAEISQAVSQSEPFLKHRISYAASLIGRATREDSESFRFILYWMALEVTVNGGEQVVTNRLAEAYGASISFVRDELELRTSIRKRSNILHRGKVEDLPAKIERLLQGYFLDLVRFETGLPCARLAELLISVGPNIERQFVAQRQRVDEGG